MNNPIDFYNFEKDYFEKKAALLDKQLTTSSVVRLSIFALFCFLIYFFFGNFQLVSIIVVIGIAIFSFLVIKHNELKYKLKKAEVLTQINQTEIDVLNGNLKDLESGNEYVNPDHFFSFDIDLFGKGSFFQYLNRTATKSGNQFLADIITENNIDSIIKKQEAINELAKKPKWRQNFLAIAKLISVDTDSKTIVDWIKNYNSFVPKFFQYIPTAFGFISILLFVLNFFEVIPFSIIFFWFSLGLITTFLFIKKINNLYLYANKAKSNFNQYHKLLNLVENIDFESEILNHKQNEIKTEKHKASVIFKKFSKILDAFDQRNNMIFGVLGNGFFLWDLQQSYKIEQWIKDYHHKVENWFDVIAFFDAYNSLGNYDFNHPKHTYPILNQDGFVIKSKDLGHPLIKKAQRIDNDFDINNKDFFIITGANMAGKSTFLRTISLSIVMANLGLPVCAKEFNYSPIKLITSMRTSDSLSEDESYFFSELKRLKFVVEEIKKDTYFIILDEILKGTNSKDKAIGSRKFVEKLVNSGSTGVIATHDLSLCEIEQEYVQIKNKYFDAEIINNELHFDYKLKKGICKNMNASFLLKKMEIV